MFEIFTIDLFIILKNISIICLLTCTILVITIQGFFSCYPRNFIFPSYIIKFLLIKPIFSFLLSILNYFMQMPNSFSYLIVPIWSLVAIVLIIIMLGSSIIMLELVSSLLSLLSSSSLSSTTSSSSNSLLLSSSLPS